MKKEERLRKNYQFKRVYQGGKSRATKNTVIVYRKNNKELNRLGISISKKVGKSVVRHRLKRLYRESYLRYKDRMKNGYDIIIVARKGAGLLKFDQIMDELGLLLKRSKIIT